MNTPTKKSTILIRFLLANPLWVTLIVVVNGLSGWARASGASYLGDITNLVAGGRIQGLWSLVLIGALIMSSSYTLRWLGALLCNYLTEKLALETRIRLMEQLKGVSFLCYEQFSSGDLQSILRNDVTDASSIIHIFLSRILNNLFLFGFTVFVMLRIDLWMTVLVVAIVLMTAAVNRRILAAQRKHQFGAKASLGKITTQIEKNHAAMDTIKTYTADEFVDEKFREERGHYNEHALNGEKVDAGRLTLYTLVNNGILFASLLYLGYRGIEGSLPVGDVLVYLYLIKQIMVPVEVIFRWMSRLVGSLAAWDRVCNLLEIPSQKLTRQTTDTEPTDVSLVSAEHISFSYGDGVAILDELSLRLHKDELTGLSGHSGSGKTTLLKVLLGLYLSPTAVYRINDGEEKDSLFGLAVYASSDALFPLTIYENITLGDEKIGREACTEMLNRLGFGEWVRSLPNGIDTIPEEKALSGGQLQSIATARALLSAAPIVILDEPFSALDVENEKRLTEELERQKSEKIILFTSHRSKTIGSCKQMIRL